MDKLIYCQKDIPKDKWRYGLRSSAATGCGWIATYNALRLLGYKPRREGLIKHYEKMLPVVHGNMGTFVYAPAVFFHRRGFKVNTTRNRKKFDRLAKQSDMCILYFWWKKGFKLGAHFVAVQHTGKGFVGYNTYRKSKGPDFYGESLDEFLNEKGYFGAMLTGIKNRAEK